MFKLLLFLHLLAAIFAVGPLVGAATTASRALRTPDAGAATAAARTIRLYSYVSIVVVVLGMGLMSQKAPWDKSQTVADLGDTWIWLSVLLWLAAMAVSLGVLVPSLTKAAAEIASGNKVATLTGRVAASGGTIGLIFAVIVVLMVYQPGG
ncbi:MAG TPA: DUF2269 family protein [Nocardioides sp.]|uniref:DUF2269 family protein n=1 Tax=Nocardioides sp. TaxID=35761 RepID=UPI002E34E141|nr:DUF2269 family protein [Nocardioides sp.]HEX3932576.1 DUF2269 family protein [Nocardioides sp.]